MNSLWSPVELKAMGFTGFTCVSDLASSRCRDVPTSPGVYTVTRAIGEAPVFLERSVGGWFKGKDPTVGTPELESRWLKGSAVLYIGKASSLRVRVRALVDYGSGRPVGHQGGRYLWQVDGCDAFEIAWRREPDPRTAEIALLASFERDFGRLPFANLSH